MKENKHSKTAGAVCAVRALAWVAGETEVFEDPYALEFAPTGWRTILNNSLLRWLVFRQLYRRLTPGVVGCVLARSRFAEDQLEDEKFRQYAILGAGLDTFFIRRKDLSDRLDVFEIDHPMSQQFKIQTAERLKIDPGEHVHFLPIDFEKNSVRDVLEESSFSRRKKTMFAWLGNTVYLSREAIASALQGMADLSPRGSRIVFDYFDIKAFEENSPYPEAKILFRSAARRGEVMQTGFVPNELGDFMADNGWRLVENLTPDEQFRRYFPLDSYYVNKPFRFVHLACAQKD